MKRLSLLLSIIVAVTIALPHLWGIWHYGKNYWPLKTDGNLQYIREETYAYAPQVQQIIKGNIRGDPYLWEYQKTPSPFVGEVASILPLVLIAKLTQNVPLAFFTADLIFPALLFFLIFWGLKKLKFATNFSLAASLAVILIPFLSILIPYPKSLITDISGPSSHPIFFSRTPHPQISSLFLFLTMFLMALAIFKKQPRFIYPLAVLIGASLYVSAYVASTSLVGTVFLLPMILRRISYKLLFFALSIFFLIALPWLINLYQLSHLPTYQDFLERSTFTKQFLFPSQLRYVLFGILLFLIAKGNIFFKILAANLLAASILVDGHQIFFARNIEADHWLSRILAPLGTLGLFLMSERFIQRFQKGWSKNFWLFITVIILTIGVVKQTVWIRANQQDLKTIPSKKNLIESVLASTQKQDVIGTLNTGLNSEIAGITGRYVYIAPGDRTLASTYEQIERVCDLAKLIPGDNQEKAKKGLNYAIGLKSFDEKEVAKALLLLGDCFKKETAHARYKLDYLVVDTQAGGWQLLKVNEKTF